MPAFLEKKLKKEYGAKSSIPYKVMNKLGFMHGNKETAKGRKAEKKHEHPAQSFAHAATKALHSQMRKAGKRDYEMEEETKHRK